MERYHGNDVIPQRVEKNTELYDEIYSQKQELTSNVTVLDNVNEIDINKIKSMINNREEYKKAKRYTNLIGREERNYSRGIEFSFEEPEPKDYDINEILKRKRNNKNEVVESEKIRKISDTQYDILKGLSLKNHDDEDEMDTSFFTKDKELQSLINTITSKSEDDKTADFFKDLKGNTTDDLTPPKAIESSNKETTKESTEFYSSKFAFAKDDFEDLEDLKKEVKKHNVAMKVLMVLIVCVVVVAIVLLAINYIDFSSLLK